MILVFFGPPGSGKGTQSSLLVKKHKFVHISAGDLLRDEIEKKTDIGLKIQGFMSRGEFVSSEIVEQIVEQKIRVSLDKPGILLDGYPRTIDQVKHLISLKLSKDINFIFFDVSKEYLLERLSNRYSCKNCGEIYNSIYRPTKEISICDNCGGVEFSYRLDDKRDAISNRLNQYYSSLDSIYNFISDNFKVFNIDAKSSVESIEFEIDMILKKS